MRKHISYVIVMCLILSLTGCNKPLTDDPAPNGLSQNTITNVPTEPTDEASISVIPDPTKDWNPNHGIVNITYKEVDDFGYREEYVFISPTEGWKAYTEPIGAGQIYIDLYKTSDGGEHWDQIADGMSPSTTITGGSIIFINSKVGWITRYQPMNGAIRLYKTLDGGITWENQDVKTSPEYSDFSPGVPVFFSEEDGIIFVSCIDTVNDDNFDLFVTTHDGGETWSIRLQDENDESFSWRISKQENSARIYEISYDKELWQSTDGIVWEKTRDK
jgi:hypothetical protein